MKPPAFAYERPDSVAATLAALARYGEDAKLLAGGQSLIAMLNLRLVAPKTVIDAGRLRELDYIRTDGNELAVGALTRHNTVMHAAEVARQCPLITDAYRFISHHAIRNRGTIGGNLCHADPASELPVVAILLDATLVLKSSSGERGVAAADFFKGPFETAARADELLTEIRFPAEPKGQGYAFDEVSQRHGDFAIVAAGCTLTVANGVCQSARLGYAGVGAHAMRLPAAEAALANQPATPASFAKAAEAAAGAVQPTSDVHADAAYRRDLVRALTARVLGAALARCG
jgi:CO/xanthine dehydrogenase FAD-binding subunit